MGQTAYHILCQIQDKADQLYNDNHLQTLSWDKCKAWVSFQRHTDLCQFEDNCFPEFNHRCLRMERMEINFANYLECEYDSDITEELIGNAYERTPRRGSRELPWSVTESPTLYRQQLPH